MIFESDEQPDEQQDTTNMPDLKSEEQAVQRNNQTPTQLAKGIKILTPNQMLSQLSIALA